MSEKLNILQKAFEVALESNSNENLEIKNNHSNHAIYYHKSTLC